MKRVTPKGIENYLQQYGGCRHDTNKMATALKIVAKRHEIKSIDLFHFIVENKPMEYTHSYGFHTGYGRGLIDEFTYEYESL